MAPETLLFRGMPTGPETFLKPSDACGLRPCARTHLKKALCHTCPVGGTVNKYCLISLCFVLRLFSGLSGIRVGWLISSSLRGPSPQALTLSGGVMFISWNLRRPSLGECRRGPRHFWECQTRVGSGPAPGSTWKMALCHTWCDVWCDVRQISLDQLLLRAEAFQQTVWNSCRTVNFLETQGAVPPGFNPHGRG